MNIERIVMLVAGFMVLASAILSVWHAPEWIYLTGFVGANLMFSGMTGFCPMVIILRKLGFKHGKSFK
ncbi:MAG: YgaP family membrane protein [Pseudomonadota bacterium]